MTKNKNEIIEAIENVFIDLYEGTRANVERLVSDEKSYKTPKEYEDEDDCYVPVFVDLFIEKQSELMNKIAEQYSEIL